MADIRIIAISIIELLGESNYHEILNSGDFIPKEGLLVIGDIYKHSQKWFCWMVSPVRIMIPILISILNSVNH
jgi:hypothetical protein